MSLNFSRSALTAGVPLSHFCSHFQLWVAIAFSLAEQFPTLREDEFSANDAGFRRPNCPDARAAPPRIQRGKLSAACIGAGIQVTARARDACNIWLQTPPRRRFPGLTFICNDCYT
ncbi:MAG: hypothetical protein WAL75_10305 [Terracidiphilus sp.]